MRVFEIPEGSKTSKGRAIQNMLQLPADDKIKTVIDVKDLDNESYIDQHNIILCTKKGIIKKTSLREFSRPRSSGVNAITIQDGDELLNVALTNGSSYILIGVKSGRAICFEETKVRNTGRGAIGVFGIELDDEKDETIGMICVHKEDKNKQILVVSEKGLGKRTPFFEIDEETKEEVTTYRVTNRGGKGVKTINITEKTGSLVGLLAIEEQEDLMISCKSGITIRMKVSSIREAGRATQGVKLINIEENDQIAAIARIAEQEDEEDEAMTDTIDNTGDENQAAPENETTE
jgi:DNA gyrase subunit A